MEIMNDIIKELSNKYEDYHISNCNNCNSEYLKKILERFSNVDKIFLCINKTEENKEILLTYLNLYNTISQFKAEKDNMNVYLENNMRIRYKKHNEITKNYTCNDKSNLTKKKIKYYFDLCKNKKKKTKYVLPIIEDAVDLDKELSSEYIEECKKSEIKIDKIKVKKCYLEEEIKEIETKILDQNIEGIIFHKGKIVFLYKEMSVEEVLEKVDKYIFNDTDFYNYVNDINSQQTQQENQQENKE